MQTITTDLRTLNPDDEARYEAVRRRDPAPSGPFYYAVATTGVYCRPDCAARLALRKNVSFFETAAAAEAAGFRACKRCRPRDRTPDSRYDGMLARARARLDTDEPPALADLAADAGMSPFHFQRVFKRVCGLSPKAYAVARRAIRIRDTLGSAATVTEAAYAAGFGSSAGFYGAARALGMTPTAFRTGAAGIAIHAGVTTTTLGTMLVAATARGVCAVLFGEDETALRAELARRFPQAHFVAEPPGFAEWLTTLARYVERPHGALDVPLDVHGTAFAQRVWRELRSIPCGETASYRTIAERIGAPGGARAVAAACARNPIAIAIPCHRVVGGDGALRGYRWGLARKRVLLEREAGS